MNGTSILSREHVFKAKEIETGKWVRGNLMQNQCETYIVAFDNNTFSTMHVIPETVCELTGLLDFDKFPVFEFDIVRDPMQILDDMIIVWCNGAFRFLSFKPNCDSFDFSFKDIYCIQSNFDSLHLQHQGNVCDDDALLYNLERFDRQSIENASSQ